MTNEKVKDFTFRVAGANKTEMIVILYDIAVTYAKDAIAAIEHNDRPLFREEVGKIRNTIKELMNSVNTSTDLGVTLLRLYIFCSGELTKGFIDYDKDAIYHVMSIIMKLRESYAEISKKDTSGPVMSNTEKVYAGFTYNKNCVPEPATDLSQNRGMLV